MAVDIRMRDGEHLTAAGTLEQMQQHLISNWTGLAEIKLEGDGRALVNTQQIVSVREHVPSTVTL
ncbi:MAG: hypothetical protein ACJ76L_00590 [Conexibacter sp.]